MGALKHPAASIATRPDAPVFSSDELETLDRLRQLARRIRSDRFLDLDKACRMLSLEPTEAAQGYAAALLRTLRQTLGRRPVLHRPGTADVSFDEAWLLRLILSAAGVDDDSLQFLIATRVPKARQRACAFLAHGLATRLDTL